MPGVTPRLIPTYTTRLGRAYNGDALDVLRRLPADSVALVMTSPPFALRRQKAYGNVAASEYVEWFWPFAQEIHRVLRPDGSFVLDLGGAWNRGSGTRSLYQYQLILRLCEIFHLAQEFYWYNPSRLPTPAEWVTIRRTRVKDAVNMLWWLSKTDGAAGRQSPRPEAVQPFDEAAAARRLRSGHAAVAARDRAALPAATTAAPFRRTCWKSPTRAPTTNISAAAGPPGCRSIRPAFRRACRSSSSAS